MPKRFCIKCQKRLPKGRTLICEKCLMAENQKIRLNKMEEEKLEDTPADEEIETPEKEEEVGVEEPTIE